VNQLLQKSSHLLENLYDEKLGLFSYSSQYENGTYKNDFSHEHAFRYTINCLAGIQRVHQAHPEAWDSDELLENFLRKQGQAVMKPSDHGFLLLVLATVQHDRTNAQFHEVQQLVGDKKLFLSLTLQDVCWLLSGITTYARTYQSDEAKILAQKVFKLINTHYLNRHTMLPVHSLSKYRNGFVSFGGITYFLKAMAEYSQAFSDRYAETLFKEGVRLVISFQGRQGEWAWFYHANKSRILDWYELYSVHQGAMAMLFLLPAVDMGVVEARDAVIKSYRWLFGENELNAPMMTDNPFFSYRSIRRKESYSREKRYARGVLSALTGTSAKQIATSDLEINTECRSYEPGWTLYAWADRSDFTEFTNLTLLSNRQQATLH
jgi:hypothetical protein